MEHDSPFIPLLLITGLAVLVPVLVSRLRFFRLPVVVGEIVAGLIIGQSGLQLVKSDVTLEFLAEFGFVFLMFLSGLEVNFGALFVAGQSDDDRPRWQRPFALASIIFGLTLVIAMLCGLLLWVFGLTRDAILMGLILSTTAAGFLLSSRLSLIIAASAIALDLQLIEAATNTAIVLVAVITCTVSPILFGRILPTRVSEERTGIIILGTNQLARLLAVRLRRDNEPVVFIGRDQQQLSGLRQAGYRVVMGPPADQATLQEACASRSRALMVLTGAYDEALAACKLARTQFGIPTIIARVDDQANLEVFQELDVQTIQPSLATLLAFEGALHFPAAFKMLQDKADGVDLQDMLMLNRRLHGRSLRQLQLPGQALIIGIRRAGEVVVPHGDTTLQLGDTLMLVGRAEDLRKARGWLTVG